MSDTTHARTTARARFPEFCQVADTAAAQHSAVLLGIHDRGSSHFEVEVQAYGHHVSEQFEEDELTMEPDYRGAVPLHFADFFDRIRRESRVTCGFTRQAVDVHLGMF
jgi:hypothetical protein